MYIFICIIVVLFSFNLGYYTYHTDCNECMNVCKQLSVLFQAPFSYQLLNSVSMFYYFFFFLCIWCCNSCRRKSQRITYFFNGIAYSIIFSFSVCHIVMVYNFRTLHTRITEFSCEAHKHKSAYKWMGKSNTNTA